MRRIRLLALTASALLVLAASAFAAQLNTYTVSGSISPSTAGSSKKPVPVAVKFGYTVGEQAGQRPALVKQYSIKFDGLRVNGAAFPKCTAAAINKAGDDSACPTKAVVGTGTVKNFAGASNDPASKALACTLTLKVYNSGKNKGALYLRGGPPACPLQVSQAIDANYIASATGVTLRFNVGGTLHHPVAGVDNAVVSVTSSIKKLTTKVKGKTVGYYESVGGCRAGKRNITVTFVTNEGQTSKAQHTISCKK
jgi:hypothetical protein